MKSQQLKMKIELPEILNHVDFSIIHLNPTDILHINIDEDTPYDQAVTLYKYLEEKIPNTIILTRGNTQIFARPKKEEI